jgi:hypothetical protein
MELSGGETRVTAESIPGLPGFVGLDESEQEDTNSEIVNSEIVNKRIDVFPAERDFTAFNIALKV